MSDSTDGESGLSHQAGASFGSALRWSAAMNIGRQVVNLAVTFVLAAVLGPTAFGLVAIAMVYVAFVQLLMEQGMNAALVQRRDLSQEHLTSAFWMVQLAALILSALAIAGSGWWGGVNDQPQLGEIVRWLTPLLILRGLIVVPDALLRRRLAFRVLAIRTNVSVLLGGVVGIIAALQGAGVWALVMQQLSTVVLEVVIVWAAVSWRPRWSFSKSAALDLFGFSWRSALASFGVFVNSRADALIIGLFLGPTAVGLYRFAARLVDTVIQSIVGSIRGVLLPEFSRLQVDPAAIARRVIQMQRLSAVAALVPLAALAAAASPLIDLVGSEWESATAAIRILALAGAGLVVGQTTGPLLQAKGRPGQLAVLTWLAAGISAFALLAGTSLLADSPITTQVTGLALVTLFVRAVVFLGINLAVMSRIAHVSLGRLFACLVPGAAAACGGFSVGWLVERVTHHLGSPLVRVSLTGGASLVVGSIVAMLLEPQIRLQASSVIGRRSKAVSA